MSVFPKEVFQWDGMFGGGKPDAPPYLLFHDGQSLRESIQEEASNFVPKIINPPEGNEAVLRDASLRDR